MGSGASQLSPEKIAELKRKTPFEEQELTQLLKWYSLYDPSEDGSFGIPYNVLLKIPELSTCHALPLVARLFINEETGTLGPESFLYFCAALSSKASVNAKRKFAFRCLDMASKDHLEYDEVFRWYKLLYSGALSDNQIMEVTLSTLHGPHVTTPGHMTYQDFCKLVSDEEIINRFTVSLQLAS